MTTVDELLNGGTKIPGVFNQYDPPGSTITARVVSQPTAEQQRDFNTGLPKFFKMKGGVETDKPMMQIRIVVATDKRDPEIEDDQGDRTVYVKNKSLKVLKEAIKNAGVERIEPGGMLTYTRVRKIPLDVGFAWEEAFTYSPPTGQSEPDDDVSGLLGSILGAEPVIDDRPEEVPAEKWAQLDGSTREKLKAALAARRNQGSMQPPF